MLRLRPYNKNDAEIIMSWIKGENAFYKWTAGVLGEYPISAEQFNTVSNLMAFTAIDDNGNEGARTWRACDWAGHKVILIGSSCKVNCKEHGVVTCRFPCARHGSRFTRKFEEQTAWMAVNCSRAAVAAFMRISWNTVGPIIERVEKDLDINPNARFDNLVRIGVDETSYRKEHKYITTVVNHDTGNVIWGLPSGMGKLFLSSSLSCLHQNRETTFSWYLAMVLNGLMNV